MKNRKKLFSSLLAVILLFSAITINANTIAYADDAQVSLLSKSTVSGKCGKDGDDVNWAFSEDDNTLTISGTGKMADYGFENGYQPWVHHIPNICRVVIENGVTYIGECAFIKFRIDSSSHMTFLPNRIIEIFISPSVVSIGEDAIEEYNVHFVIKGYTGSYAETYAKRYDFEFESVGTVSTPTPNPTPEPTLKPTTKPTPKPTEEPLQIIPAETAAPVCSEFAGKVTVDFKVSSDGKAKLDIENINPNNTEKIQTTAYAAYFDSRGNLTGVDILTSDEQGNYSFNIKNGNYKIMLWDNFKPIINALKQPR